MTLITHRGINQIGGCITGNGCVKKIIWLIKKKS